MAALISNSGKQWPYQPPSHCEIDRLVLAQTEEILTAKSAKNGDAKDAKKGKGAVDFENVPIGTMCEDAVGL